MAEIAKLIRKCLYCGDDVGRDKRGEHIVPEAIGGEMTVKEVSGKGVCPRCNNGVLARLDDELSRRSFLADIASQELSKNLWQIWDIDHGARNLLVEARPEWVDGELKTLLWYPQLIFEKSGPELRGDAEEMEKFGREQFEKVFMDAVQRAYRRFNSGQTNALNRERVRNDIQAEGYRLAPRVFTRNSISEIANNVANQKFTLRFITAEDLQFAMNSLGQLKVGDARQFMRYRELLTSPAPSISNYFDLGLTLRAMMKIGVNLLAAYCSKTTVSCDTFRAVTRLILGKTHPHELVVASNGFVQAADIQEIAQPKCHTFRLTYMNGEWRVYLSFFGGRIGGAVTFPGPNQEEWNTLNVIAPIHSKNWLVTQNLLIYPMKVRIEWSDIAAIAPSLRTQSARSTMLTELVPVDRT